MSSTCLKERIGPQAGIQFTSWKGIRRSLSGIKTGCPPKRRRRSDAAPDAEAKAKTAVAETEAKPVIADEHSLSEILQGSRVLLSGKDTKELAASVKTMGGCVTPMPSFQASSISFASSNSQKE